MFWLHWRRDRRARVRAIAARLDEMAERQRRAEAEHLRDWETMKGLLLADSAAAACPELATIAEGTAGPVVRTEIDGQEVIIGAWPDGGGDQREMTAAVRRIVRKWQDGGRVAS